MNVATNLGKKFPMHKFHGNPMSCSPAVTCVCTEMGKPTRRNFGTFRYKYAPRPPKKKLMSNIWREI
jgi:hypothetical protein